MEKLQKTHWSAINAQYSKTENTLFANGCGIVMPDSSDSYKESVGQINLMSSLSLGKCFPSYLILL